MRNYFDFTITWAQAFRPFDSDTHYFLVASEKEDADAILNREWQFLNDSSGGFPYDAYVVTAQEKVWYKCDVASLMRLVEVVIPAANGYSSPIRDDATNYYMEFVAYESPRQDWSNGK